MKQVDFLNQLKEYIGKTASRKNPQVTANAIYFITKQNPEIKQNKTNYSNMLKKVKVYLRDNFGWSMVEIHKCFCVLHGLMKVF